jgi:hypothetical protein
MPKRKGSPYRDSDVVHAISGSRVRFCAVYIVGTRKDVPVRIGYHHCPQDDLDNGEQIFAVRWVREWKLARRIVKESFDLLARAGKNLDAGGQQRNKTGVIVTGGRFAIDVVWAERVIGVIARKTGIELYSDGDLKKFEITKRDLRWHSFARSLHA